MVRYSPGLRSRAAIPASSRAIQTTSAKTPGIRRPQCETTRGIPPVLPGENRCWAGLNVGEVLLTTCFGIISLSPNFRQRDSPAGWARIGPGVAFHARCPSARSTDGRICVWIEPRCGAGGQPDHRQSAGSAAGKRNDSTKSGKLLELIRTTRHLPARKDIVNA